MDMTDMPKGPFFEDNVSSRIYPYNAYMHPFDHLKLDGTTTPTMLATRLQRLLVPSIMPAELDPNRVIAERNRYVDARIEQWTHKLERLAAMMSDGGLESILDDVANEDKENSLTLEDVAS